MDDFKVFFNDSFVLITDHKQTSKAGYKLVLNGKKEAKDFLENTSSLFDEHWEGNILMIIKNKPKFLNYLFKSFHGIIAGGGIIKNERDETLIIHRRGFWDLPKGKVEKSEQIIETALREVEEETGVKIMDIEENPILTYHCYLHKGKKCIKETHWFNMYAVAGKNHLIPQVEEQIDEVIWANNHKVQELKYAFFPLIRELLKL